MSPTSPAADREPRAPGGLRRIALFADVQNLYYTTRQAYARQFDYRALWRRVAATGDIVCANAYATDRGDRDQQRFQKALEHIGFTLRLKPFIQRADGSAKGDWDVGLTIDVLAVAPVVDTVVLLSGDGDFDCLVETLRCNHGVHVDVYGVPALSARSLIAAASRFYPIDDELLM